MRKLATERFLGHPFYIAIGVLLTLVVVGSLVAPDQSSALSPTDLPVVGQVLNNVVPGALDPTQWPVEGFKAIVNFIFGDISGLGKNLINLLLSVPILTDAQKFVKLNQYREYITGAAWGLLGLSLVISSMRYWIAGYASVGAYEALTGFARSTASICMLLVFVQFFDQLTRLVNAFTYALVINPIVGNGLSRGMTGAISTDNLAGGGIAMLVTIIAVVLGLILLIVKVIVIALLAVFFVASPLAIALWPIEELSWILRSLLQAMLALLMFPIVWAICFGTFAMLNVDSLFPGDHGEFIDQILSPLLVLASLIVAFRLPFAFLSMGTRAGISPGIVGRGVGHARGAVSSIPSGRFSTPVPRMKVPK